MCPFHWLKASACFTTMATALTTNIAVGGACGGLKNRCKTLLGVEIKSVYQKIYTQSHKGSNLI